VIARRGEGSSANSAALPADAGVLDEVISSHLAAA